MKRLMAILALILSGCTGATSDASQTVTVFAAASLTDAFTQIGKDFAAATPGKKVTFSFAGSSALAWRYSPACSVAKSVCPCSRRISRS